MVNLDDYDPLEDTGLNSLTEVTEYTSFVVTEDCEGRPDLISYKFYRTPNFWWAILGYNSISEIRSLIRGLKIRIPDYSQLVTALNKRNYYQNSPSLTKTMI